MFFAMGITWISDAISDALDANNGVVVFFTVVNSLQGLILFVAVALGEEKVRQAAAWLKAKATCSKVKDDRARKLSSLTIVSGNARHKHSPGLSLGSAFARSDFTLMGLVISLGMEHSTWLIINKAYKFVPNNITKSPVNSVAG
jgi:hypothetical protein